MKNLLLIAMAILNLNHTDASSPIPSTIFYQCYGYHYRCATGCCSIGNH